MSRLSSFTHILVAGMGFALLSACGANEEEGEQAVTMRDMEVMDGTATDAMTDLDGVQTEGLALPPAPNATRPVEAATETGNSGGEDEASEDVVAEE